MIDRRAARLPILAFGVGLGLLGCTVEDPVFRQIGTAVPFLTDSDLSTQPVTASPAEHTIQVVEWTIARADFTFDGVATDLTFGEECSFTDTAFVITRGQGACAQGVVIESGLGARPVTFELSLTMRVRRAEPLSLPPAADYDGDGVSNATDNCILIDNPDQTPGSGDFGEACAVRDPFSGATFLDNDRDGIADVFDNCPQVANPEQEDTRGVGAGGIPDGIGDACVEQSATVRIGGSEQIELLLGPEDLVQAQFRTTFLTVDFESSIGLSCLWNAGVCDLDAGAVEFCLLGSSVGTCP